MRLSIKAVPVCPLLAVTGLLFGACGGAAAQRERVVVPAGTIVRVKLDERVTSRDAREGERVSASVSQEDRSGFPERTEFEGVITQVQRASDDRPGVVDMDFRRAVLPDGRAVAIDGALASLADGDVRRTSDGRLETRRGGRGNKIDLKWVGYGAAGGAVLGEILGGGFLKGALLGGLGGAIYGYVNRDKDRGQLRDVVLERGTEFGIRLDQRIAFDDRNDFRYRARQDLPRDTRVLGEREEARFGTTDVRVNDRSVRFGESRPLTLNGVLYIPLQPVAEAANLRFTHERGDEQFTLRTSDGVHEGTVNTARLGADDEEMAGAVLINGEVFVTTEYLSRHADMRVRWNRVDRMVDLESYRAVSTNRE